MVIGKYFTKYYGKYWYTFLLGIAALFIVDYAQLFLPDIIGDIVDGISNKTLVKDDLFGFTKSLIIIAVVVFAGRMAWRVCIFGNGVKIETDIRNEMFLHMEKLSTNYYHENKTGALMALYTNDLNTIRRSFAGGTLMLIDALSLGILAFYKMIKLSWKLAIICLVPLIAVSAFATLMENKISKLTKKNLESFSELSDYTQEDYSGISVIKAFVKEKRKEFLFGPYNEKNATTAFAYTKVNTIVGLIIGVVLSTMTLTIIFVGGTLIYQAKQGVIVTDFTVGKLITFNSYFMSLIWPIMAVGDLINLRGQSKACEQRVSALLDEVPEINDNKADIKDLQVSDIKGGITFNDVTYKYPTKPYPIIQNVSFEIKPGEIVGIMGGTGSGKSSIVNLILRLYNLEDNKVLIDGYDIMHLPVKLVRDAVAYVPQETFLFKQSIDENIAFSMDHIDPELTHKAALNAGISKDIEEFKDGYDTILGERGVTVSGGQKQRISIARALLKDAPILILDDSLSAVDTVTEEFILEKLRDLRKGKTSIVIAHRITTLETLDKIIVLKEGKVEAIGTHEELQVISPTYKKEVFLQELEKEVTR